MREDKHIYKHRAVGWPVLTPELMCCIARLSQALVNFGAEIQRVAAKQSTKSPESLTVFRPDYQQFNTHKRCGKGGSKWK